MAVFAKNRSEEKKKKRVEGNRLWEEKIRQVLVLEIAYYMPIFL